MRVYQTIFTKYDRVRMARVDFETWERKRGGKRRSFIKTEARSTKGKIRSFIKTEARSTIGKIRSCSKRDEIVWYDNWLGLVLLELLKKKK